MRGLLSRVHEEMPVPSGPRLGGAITAKILYPTEAEKARLVLTAPPVEIVNGAVQMFAIVDDGGRPHPWPEWRTDNDRAASVSGECDGPK